VVRVPDYISRGPRFDSWFFQIFWEVVGLERGPPNLVSTIEELLERNSSASGLKSREYGHGDALCWPRDTLYPQKLALTSTCCGRSVGVVLLWTKATEFSFSLTAWPWMVEWWMNDRLKRLWKEVGVVNGISWRTEENYERNFNQDCQCTTLVNTHSVIWYCDSAGGL
jgi:hypothetical protein